VVGGVLLAGGSSGLVGAEAQRSLKGVWWIFASMHTFYAGTMALIMLLSWRNAGRKAANGPPPL